MCGCAKDVNVIMCIFACVHHNFLTAGRIAHSIYNFSFARSVVGCVHWVVRTPPFRRSRKVRVHLHAVDRTHEATYATCDCVSRRVAVSAYPRTESLRFDCLTPRVTVSSESQVLLPPVLPPVRRRPAAPCE